MKLYERIGIDVGRKLVLEEALAWAAAHAVRFVDVQLDTGANALGTIDAARGAAVRRECERHRLHLGLHTSSAVNVAEYAPYVSDAVEQYLRAYIDASRRQMGEEVAMVVPVERKGFMDRLLGRRAA